MQKVTGGFKGAYYRKVSTEEHSSIWGLRGEGKLPEITFDQTPARYYTEKDGVDNIAKGLNHFRTGPLDRPSVYMGGHSGKHELDAGLTWDRVYDAKGRPTYTDDKNWCSKGIAEHTFIYVGKKLFNLKGVQVASDLEVKPNFAFRVFWRTTGTKKKPWNNPAKDSPTNFYFYPGEEYVMRTQVIQAGKVQLRVRSVTDPLKNFRIDFDQPGFGLGQAQSFKRVNSIDQFRIDQGKRVGNERLDAIPTSTTALGGAWTRVDILDSAGAPLRPMAGDNILQIVAEDLLQVVSSVFRVTGASNVGAEIVDIVPTTA